MTAELSPTILGAAAPSEPEPSAPSSDLDVERGCGAGASLVFAPSANAVLAAVRPHQAGQASGATNAIREIGGVFGIAVLASVFTNLGGYGTSQLFVNGLRPAILVGSGVLALGALAALLVPGVRAIRAGVELVGEAEEAEAAA